MDAYIGKKLNDRYEIIDLIGYGSVAVVYKARDHRLGRDVAVKILNSEFSNNAELLQQFYSDSQKISSLSHANIVDIYDISQHQDIHFIVMEYLNGISLKQFITYKKVLSWNQTIYFSLYILKALEYAHAHGIIHRDLKPQNVIILRDGTVKVTDFSIAHISTNEQTLSRSKLESAYYLSPEQSNGAQADIRSDLYSLGVMMYEMMTGQVPYNGETTVAIAVQHVNGNPVPPRSIQPGIPIGLQQITLHAMNSDIICRYNTAKGMRKDLEMLQNNPRIGFRFRVPVRKPAEVAAAAASAPEVKPLPDKSTDDSAADHADTLVVPDISVAPAIENSPDSSEADSPETAAEAAQEVTAAAGETPEMSPAPDSHIPVDEPEQAEPDDITPQDDINLLGLDFGLSDQFDAPLQDQSFLEEGDDMDSAADDDTPYDEEIAEDEEDYIDDDYESDDEGDEEYEDDEDEDDEDAEDKPKKGSGIGVVLILLLILLIIGALIFFFRDLVASYIAPIAQMISNAVRAFFS